MVVCCPTSSSSFGVRHSTTHSLNKRSITQQARNVRNPCSMSRMATFKQQIDSPISDFHFWDFSFRHQLVALPLLRFLVQTPTGSCLSMGSSEQCSFWHRNFSNYPATFSLHALAVTTHSWIEAFLNPIPSHLTNYIRQICHITIFQQYYNIAWQLSVFNCNAFLPRSSLHPNSSLHSPRFQFFTQVSISLHIS